MGKHIQSLVIWKGRLYKKIQVVPLEQQGANTIITITKGQNFRMLVQALSLSWRHFSIVSLKLLSL